MAQYSVPSYSGVIENDSRDPEWFSMVRGQIGKKGLVTGKDMDNTVSKCKDVPLLLQKSCSKFT